MNIPFVDLKAQYDSIKPEIDGAMSEVIARTAFIGGPYVKAFETAFAGFCGVKHCVAVGNGTDAITIALRTLGIGPGDEVITVANSFIATSEAVTMTGARVVFVDINPETYNIDAAQIEAKITPKTRAILPVHLYGQPADMDPIMEIARKYELKIVEDAAQAHGAEYKGRQNWVHRRTWRPSASIRARTWAPTATGGHSHQRRRPGREGQDDRQPRQDGKVQPQIGRREQSAGRDSGRHPGGQAEAPPNLDRSAPTECSPLQRV